MTTNAANPVDRLIAAGGQKAFLLLLSVASVLGAIGFSLTIFGIFSGLLSTTFDQLMVAAIGVVLMVLASWVSYTAIN